MGVAITLRKKIARSNLNRWFRKFKFPDESRHYNPALFIDTRSLINALIRVFEDSPRKIETYCRTILKNYDNEIAFKNHRGKYYHWHIITALKYINKLDKPYTLKKAKEILIIDNINNKKVIENNDKEFMYVSYYLDDMIFEIIKEAITSKEKDIFNLLKSTYETRKSLYDFNPEHKVNGYINILDALSLYYSTIPKKRELSIILKREVVDIIGRKLDEDIRWKDKFDNALEELKNLIEKQMGINGHK